MAKPKKGDNIRPVPTQEGWVKIHKTLSELLDWLDVHLENGDFLSEGNTHAKALRKILQIKKS